MFEDAWEEPRPGTNPTGRKGELRLDPELVSWTRAFKSLSAWLWLILG